MQRESRNVHNETTGKITTILKHLGDMHEGTLRAILKQAVIESNKFLKKS